MLAGLALFALAMVSCEKELQENEYALAEEKTVVQGEPVFFLTAGIDDSKIALDGVTVNWTAGDQIVVNGITSRPLESADINGHSARFGFDALIDAPYHAVYPASAYVDDSYEVQEENPVANIILPVTQNVSAGAFDPAAAIMIGTGGVDGLTFEHAVTYLKLTFDQDVKSVRVMANNGIRVRGWMKADFSARKLENYHTGWNFNTVTADCGEGIAAGDPVIIAIPPKDYSDGLNFFVVTTDGRYQILRTLNAAVSGKAGVLLSKSATLSGLETYQGPGIYSNTDWRSFVCADESKFTTDVTQQEDAAAWIGEDGEVNIYKDFTTDNLHRHGSNYAVYPGASNNIYFTETLDGNNHTITQTGSTTPMIAWLGTADVAGTVKNLTLAGSCTEPGTWGNAAFAVRIFRGGVLDHCTNAINTDYTETQGAHSTLYFAGLALSNGGTIRDCENSGNMDITILSDSTRVFKAGGIAVGNNYDGQCGDFIRCNNSGNITIVKNAVSNSNNQSLRECGIGGICGTVTQGVPGTNYTGVYSRFVQCENTGAITFWEEKSGTGSGNQLATAVGGILGMSTLYNSSCPYVGANDQGYYFIIDQCTNTGTLDVSTGNNIQPLANNMSGARQTYVGGIVGFAMGSNNPSTATSDTYYPVIRGTNNATIKVGSEKGSEAAGGLVGGGGFLKFDYLRASSTIFAKSANPNRTPQKVGGVAAFVGWVVKRCTAVPNSTVRMTVDASGLDGLTLFGEGVAGVTGASTKNAAGAIPGANVNPIFIFETSGSNYFEMAVKYSDGTTEPAASLSSGYQAASKTFYGKATTSCTYLRKAGNLRFVDFD